MRLRCDLHVNGGSRKLVLAAGPNETGEHLALKLGAFLLFWDQEPIVDASAKHPALLGQEFIPDLMALTVEGQAGLWVECGQTSMNKLAKVVRRFPYTRLVVLKASEREAERLRRDLASQHDRPERVEVLGWPADSFKEWKGALSEKTEVYGEGGGLMLNAVVNERPIVAELRRF
jgi:hypothetical protein